MAAVRPDGVSTGRPVAKQLQIQYQSAVAISQGGSSGPGGVGAGSQPLYQTVQIAAKQPTWINPDNARAGPEFFAFGAPGSAACAAAARAFRITPLAGQHCYIAGPQGTLQDLRGAMPAGVSLAGKGVQTLRIPQGWVVLQAVSPRGYGQPLPWSNPTSQYFVLRDKVALFGNEITNPQQATDQSGQPDVTFGFTAGGGKAFQQVTAQIARRGNLVSGLGQSLNQHFAVALDTQLITVPSIDFKTYPDGIPGDNGADITGGFTIDTAQQLAQQLRLGALPVELKLVGESKE